mmetsp:Transcript_1088/g.2110  ORF Transcript_1088/g.2110 Transcript_1088/m.2110 type:complete len:204 (-) Transcript_1088:2889-3500(-)
MWNNPCNATRCSDASLFLVQYHISMLKTFVLCLSFGVVDASLGSSKSKYFTSNPKQNRLRIVTFLIFLGSIPFFLFCCVDRKFMKTLKIFLTTPSRVGSFMAILHRQGTAARSTGMSSRRIIVFKSFMRESNNLVNGVCSEGTVFSIIARTIPIALDFNGFEDESLQRNSRYGCSSFVCSTMKEGSTSQKSFKDFTLTLRFAR